MSSTRFVNGVTLTDEEWFNFLDATGYNYLSSVAGTNTITATGPKGMSAYSSGQRFILVPANANTGATTLNITPETYSALGAKNIFSNNAACVGGELKASVPYLLAYDGTQFQLVGAMLSGGILDLSAANQGQIKFPATQKVSTDANTLDDYEEGTWTPTINFGSGSTGITYTTQLGKYTKIGKLVFASFYIVLSSKGTDVGVANVGDLPFDPDTGNLNYLGMSCVINLWSALATNWVYISGRPVIGVGGYDIRLTGAAAAGTAAATLLADTDFTNTTNLQGCITYIATA